MGVFLRQAVFNIVRQLLVLLVRLEKQVCMICLDTDSELFLMSKHKLEEAYQHLTGNPPCDLGNLKQTLCVHCAQRLINFSRFRDKSLRARALMVDLVQRHELITRLHIKKINRTEHQLKSNMMVTTLAPDHCDLHVLEDMQRESAETIDTDVVKTEAKDELMLVDEDMEGIQEDDHADSVNDEFVAPNEEYSSEHTIELEAQLLEDAVLKALNRKAAVSTQVAVTQDIFKCESASYQCTLCFEEFVLAPAYSQHLSTHLQNGAAADDPQQLSDDPRPSADLPPTSVALPASRSTNNETKVPPAEEDDSNDEQVPASDIASEDVSCQATSQNKVPATLNNPNLSSLQSKTFCSNNDVNIPYNSSPANVERKSFSCDVCTKMFKQKRFLTNHIKTHAEVMQLNCKICQHKCKNENALMRHMHVHTGDKPYICKLCKYKCSQKSNLMSHMRTHTREKPFTCELCKYKCSRKDTLVRHMRTHTGDKPFTCELCKYKCSEKKNFRRHMRTHTTEKPFTCELCKYKCSRKDTLVRHMRTHTGDKPFTCELCKFKCSHNNSLVRHMRTHSGDKPYICMLCKFKCSHKHSLVNHMKTHTGEKPFTCEVCKYKCSIKGSLVSHMRTHTGDKPFTCKLCKFKSPRKNTLVIHMRTHTGDKPFSCELCKFKCSQKNSLVRHMRTH